MIAKSSRINSILYENIVVDMWCQISQENSISVGNEQFPLFWEICAFKKF